MAARLSRSASSAPASSLASLTSSLARLAPAPASLAVTAVAALGALALWPGGAVAGPALVLEVHERVRPVGAGRVLAPALRELGEAGFATGARAARIVEERVSRPAPPPGSRPGARQLLAMASADLRRGRAGEAERAMAELVRRYPDAEPSQRQHGAAAVALYRELRRKASRAGTGRLVVEVSEPSAVVFVDDRFRGVGAVDDELAAGPHRVYVQMGKQPGRLHQVVVRAGARTRLRVAWEVDGSVRTGADWAGLVLARAGGDPLQTAAPLALAVARAAGAERVALLAIDARAAPPALVGVVLDTATGRVLRRRAVSIERGSGDGSAAQSSADQSSEDEDSDDEDSDDSGTDAAALGLARALIGHATDAPARSGGGWQKWTLAGASLLALGGGAALVQLDGRCQRPFPGRACPVSWQSAPYGWTAIGAGAALAVASAYFFWRDAQPLSAESRAATAHVTLAPGPGGLAIAADLTFAF